MPLTRPIPGEAMSVVEILRRDVPRPKELPMPMVIAACYEGVLPRPLRWRGKGDRLSCYAIGLHPKSTEQAYSKEDFPLASDEEIQAFVHWWDEQTDAHAAVDAVWPEAGK